MIYILLIVIFAYSIILMYLFFQLKRTELIEENFNGSPISILIPVRNEQQNVSRIIQNLKKLDYCCYEVVIVDDHSDDDTVKLLIDANLEFVRVIYLPDSLYGKKNAIKYGLTYCKGEWVVFTDADVNVSANWLKVLSKYFSRAEFILAPVLIKKSNKKSLLLYIETLDVLAMQAITCAATNAKYPFLASAANMAVKRNVAIELYKQMDTNISSGDDVFLLHEYLKKRNRVLFVVDDAAKVFVQPSTSWLSFFKQRLRWASKAKYYRNKNALFFSWLIFLVHILPVLTVIELVFFKGTLSLLIWALLIKFVMDTAFIAKGIYLFKQSVQLLFLLPLIWIFYFFYISFVPILSLVLNVEWKNRITK